MRIALLHPTYWPEVRRGSERLIHDLGVELVRRGHQVSVLTTHRGRSRSAIEDGLRIERARRLPQRGPLRWYEHHVGAALPALARLRQDRFDVAHAFFPVESWAAVKARAHLGGPPVLSTFHGIPRRSHLVKARYRLEMMMAAAAEAEQVSVLSEAAAEPYERYFGRRPLILPGGVIASDFEASAPRCEQPTILCAASIGDPRKRGELLFEAFARVRALLPEARLRLVRTADPVLSAEIGDLPPGAEWVEGDETPALARAYATSWVSVLPSIDEAFGLVLVESLAAGTPVIAADSGACPEIVTGQVGALFEPDDVGSLSSALVTALAKPPDGRRAATYRAHAVRWDWPVVADDYVRAYEELTAT